MAPLLHVDTVEPTLEITLMETPRDADSTNETDATLETYVTDSGMIADIDDVEVDLLPSGDGELVSSQADAETYGVELDQDVSVPELPEE